MTVVVVLEREVRVCERVFDCGLAGLSAADVFERFPRPASTQRRSRVSKICTSSTSVVALMGQTQDGRQHLVLLGTEE